MECMRLQSTKLPNHQIIVTILLFKWGKKIQQYKKIFTQLNHKLSSNQIETFLNFHTMPRPKSILGF